ncbi:MAG TPA: macro domain-containing protein [Candidatus Mediterraneibacter cottocaccae]|nr:macro domain-containing protein [Candidatus Mediterraneibacter cottocaccae]
MIEYTKGNMFESGADCLINTVNCEGYMGKGIAYQFKMRFPENNKSYVKACRSGRLTVGKVHWYTEDGITIVNFPTKDKWREKSKIEYIENGMDSLIELLPELKVKRIAIPPLGCGNGGLNWRDVRGIIENKISGMSQQYDFLIFEPSNGDYKAVPKKPPQISVSGLVLLDIRMNLKRFNRIRLQKTGYFVNCFLGEEYFRFDKWKYGPYSHAIDIVARNIKEYQEYYGLSDSQKTFDHLYQTICSAKVDQQFQRIHGAVKKAAEYVNNIETEKKLEGVATVLYLVQDGTPKNRDQLVRSFHEWSEDKAARFSEEAIEESIRYLEDTALISRDICGNYELVGNVW